MKRLIEFFKKLFGCKQVCPKCKSNPCKCEMEVPAEHKVELKEPEIIHAFDTKNATYVSGFSTVTNIEDHNLKGLGDTCYTDNHSKLECESKGTTNAIERKILETAGVELKRMDHVEIDPEIVSTTKRAHKKKVTSSDESTPEVPAEPKKKRSRKKKTESK